MTFEPFHGPSRGPNVTEYPDGRSATVVGAGLVVVHDLPPGVLAVGNPARVVRSLVD